MPLMTEKPLQVVREILGRVYSDREWEALCGRCGRCCFESRWVDEGWEHTSIPCRYLDDFDRSCKVYGNRFQAQQECVRVTASVVLSGMLPSDCTYVEEVERIVEEDYGGEDPRKQRAPKRNGKSRRTGERSGRGRRRRIHEQ